MGNFSSSAYNVQEVDALEAAKDAYFLPEFKEQMRSMRCINAAQFSYLKPHLQMFLIHFGVAANGDN